MMAVIKINRRGQIQNRCSKLNSRMFSHRAYVKPDSIQNFLLTLRYDVAAEKKHCENAFSLLCTTLFVFRLLFAKKGKSMQ